MKNENNEAQNQRIKQIHQTDNKLDSLCLFDLILYVPLTIFQL